MISEWSIKTNVKVNKRVFNQWKIVGLANQRINRELKLNKKWNPKFQISGKTEKNARCKDVEQIELKKKMMGNDRTER